MYNLSGSLAHHNIVSYTVHTVKSVVSLKWQVGFENDMKITPITKMTPNF